MATVRTPDEAFAAGWADAKDTPPLTQDQADYVAAIRASQPPQKRATAA